MKYLFEKYTNLFYMVSAILLSSLLTILYWSNQNEIASAQKIIHTQEIINKSNEIVLNILTIETGFRGYLLTENVQFLEPYEEAKMKVKYNIVLLEKLTKNNPEEQLKIAILKKELTDRLAFTKKYVVYQKTDAISVAQKKEIIESGSYLTNKISAAVKRINSQEVDYLVLAKIENQSNNQISMVLYFLLLVFLAAIFTLVIQISNNQKGIKTDELAIANKELAFQNNEKEKRANELIIANKELNFQNREKVKRADELVIADIELDFQNKEKEKRLEETKELEALNYSAKLASQYTLSLIEASLDPLVTINIEGKITDMNQATVTITGMKREELKGSDFFDYFTEPIMARQVYKEVFAKGSVADSPLTLRHKKGKLTDVLFNGSVYKDDCGNVMGVVIVARDVTDQKRIENELIEARVFAELATGIAEEAQAKAESATRIAEDAVKAKQQFLSNMSHEIRTPMNAIIGFTKVVLKTDLSAKQREYLSAIKMSGDALIVLINDILDLAKVDAGKMVFEQVPFQMKQSIKAMLHVFETKIQEKNLELITQYDSTIPEVLLGDSVRLHQIILNLVSNAVKFTNKGTITVSVVLLSQNEEQVTIEFAVSDTGIGIPDNKIDTIFENFQQASSGTSRLYGGTGLGLAIVKQLVESQAGVITVKSKVNEGSTFSFVLNFLKTNAPAEIDTTLLEINSENKSIQVLVVEDMALNQLLMKTLLDDFGFERDIAENGQIAVEKLQKNTYDIVLMDLQMPIMNGFEATEYIRNILKLNIPIVALTADVTTVDLAKCKAVGMNDYIAKPVDERLLYHKIIALVKNSLPPKEISKAKVEKKLGKTTIPKYTNLDYLKLRTKSNPKMMSEIIAIYLEQTPTLIATMQKSVLDKNYALLSAAAHKIIPSFAIIGMSQEFENKAKQIQEQASAEKFTDQTAQMVTQLEMVCNKACQELEIELNLIKNI